MTVTIRKFKVAAKVYTTDDYSLFDMADRNRPIHKDDVLLGSMAKFGFMYSHPMQCVELPDGRLKIVCGHHRFRCAMRLKIPVMFVIDNLNTDMYALEGSGKSGWSSYDFGGAAANSGDPDACAMMDFKDEHGLSMGVAASLLHGENIGSGGALKQMKKGTFKVGDTRHAESVAAVTDTIYARGVRFARMGHFVNAVSAVVRVPELDYDRLLHQAHLYATVLSKRSTAAEYMQEVEAMYNYRYSKAEKFPLAFRARQSAAGTVKPQ